MRNLIVKIFRRIALIFRNVKASLNTVVQVHAKGKLSREAGVKLRNATVKVGRDSSLSLEAGVQISNCRLRVGEGCKVVIRKGAVLKDLNFFIQNQSEVLLGEGCIFDGPAELPKIMYIDNGKLIVGEKAHIQSSVVVRFGAELRIGKFSSSGYGSEIVCEERIEIGDFCLFSYDVCIYDTDSHSINSDERRQSIEQGYPFGAHETTKPATSPIIIGNDVWIGKGAAVLKGAKVGDGCIVGMRTVLGRGSYPPGSTIVSDPPRIIVKNN